MNITKIGRHSVQYFDREEFLNLKKEIFENEIYSVQLPTDSPVIIDLGAYIGLSVLYFKSLFPSSRIIAVEPNPEAFKLLSENVEANGLTDVSLFNKAVWKKSQRKGFFIDGTERGWNSTAGFYHGMWTGQQKTTEIEVETITLSELMGDKYVDLMKVDIEGAETAVLTTSEALLKRVRNLIVEFHPLNERQDNKLLKFLRRFYNQVEITATEQGLSIIRAISLKE